MANSLGTLAATQVIVQEALELVFTMRPLLKDISTGFTDKNGTPYALFNQAVYTRVIAVPAVVDFPAAPAARVDTDASVTLNAYKAVWHQFTPQEISSTNRDLLRESVKPMAVALANGIVDAVAGVWTIGNFPTRTGADAVANGATSTKTILGAGWDYSHLITVRKQMNKAGVPFTLPRFYAGNSDVYGSLSNDQRIVGYFWNQNNGSAISSGHLPNVQGFDISEYPGLPNTGNLAAFAGSPDSTLYAQRVARDPRDMPGFSNAPVPGLMTVVTEPITGLSVNLDLWIDMDARTPNARLSWMYGVGVGNANNGQLIVTA